MGTSISLAHRQGTDKRMQAGERSRLGMAVAYCQRNPQLVAGVVLVSALVLVGPIGSHVIDVKRAQPLSDIPSMPPSVGLPLGSDDQGRDLLAVLVAGLPLTLSVGFLAGSIGLVTGTILGLISGSVGGVVDAIIRMAVDTLLTVPALMVLIIIAASIKGVISITIMALVIASLAWMNPTRTVRAQVLTLRERGYIQIARLSGMSSGKVIVSEMLPNLLPYLAAGFVGAVSAAVLASIGLEALGLGPQNEPTVGMTIYWALLFNAPLRGMWWWWFPPILVVVALFLGLLLVSAGLDEVANPRHRRRA
ncbi:MAG TPA: ABC transporter permease [Chloroflexota bacterium]|jgi:peptide/nickel transport system permease protein